MEKQRDGESRAAGGGPAALFPINAEVSYVTTDRSVSTYLRDRGYRALHHREADVRDVSAAVLLITDWAVQDEIAHLLKTSWRQARVVWIPFAAFDASLEAVAYGVERFGEIDFPVAGERTRPYVGALSSEDLTSFSLRGADADCRFTRTADLHVNQRPWRPLRRGETVGVAALIEVEVEASYRRTPPFVFEGVFRARALCAGHGPRIPAHAPAVARAATLIRRAAAAGEPLDVEVVSNRLQRCSIGREDITGELLALVDRGDREVLEFAFGTSTLPESAYDWSINSPLNEGSRNFHIGIGHGESGLHFDLICFGEFDLVSQKDGASPVGV